MKKILIFSILIYTLSFSDFIYSNGKCVKSFNFDSNNFNILYSKDDFYTSTIFDNTQFNNMISNGDLFIYDSGFCKLRPTNFLGVDYSQFNFLFALFGILFGNTILIIFANSMNRR